MVGQTKARPPGTSNGWLWQHPEKKEGTKLRNHRDPTNTQSLNIHIWLTDTEFPSEQFNDWHRETLLVSQSPLLPFRQHKFVCALVQGGYCHYKLLSLLLMLWKGGPTKSCVVRRSGPLHSWLHTPPGSLKKTHSTADSTINTNIPQKGIFRINKQRRSLRKKRLASKNRSKHCPVHQKLRYFLTWND